MRQQLHRSALPGRQIVRSRRESALRHAFLNAPSALPARPEPRTAFDNAARRDNPSRPWHAFADPLRAAAVAAAQLGGTCAELTEDRITHAVLAMLEYVLEPLQPADAADIPFTLIVREEAEALEAQAVARAMPTAEHLAAAVRETDEAIALGRLYCASAAERASLLTLVRS